MIVLTRSSDADILIGGMDRDMRVAKTLWISIPYIQDDQTWCVATARPRDIWRNIFGIYTMFTWSILIATIFFIASVIYAFMQLEHRPENYAWTLLVGMAAALGQTGSYEPWRTSIRVFMCFLFMYGLVMSTSFSSFLISILTRPRFKTQINTVRSAIDAGFQFTGGDLALSHYGGVDEVNDHFTFLMEKNRGNFQMKKNFRIHRFQRPFVAIFTTVTCPMIA